MNVVNRGIGNGGGTVKFASFLYHHPSNVEFILTHIQSSDKLG